MKTEEEKMVEQVFFNEWELLPLRYLSKKWEDEADYVVKTSHRREFVDRLMPVAKMYHPDPRPILEGLAREWLNNPYIT